MQYRFNAEEWSRLSAKERVNRCKLMALEARKLADTSNPTTRGPYLLLAKDWETLAAEIERASKDS